MSVTSSIQVCVQLITDMHIIAWIPWPKTFLSFWCQLWLKVACKVHKFKNIHDDYVSYKNHVFRAGSIQSLVQMTVSYYFARGSFDITAITVQKPKVGGHDDSISWIRWLYEFDIHTTYMPLSPFFQLSLWPCLTTFGITWNIVFQKKASKKENAWLWLYLHVTSSSPGSSFNA